MFIRNASDLRNTGYRAKGRSPNALEDPGHNGIVHEGVRDYTFTDFQISDAGEHGVRFGGTREGEIATESLTVSAGLIKRSGQSGFKVWGGEGRFFKQINVTGVNVIDCQWDAGAGTGTGFNDEGFLLQNVVYGTFSGLSVTKEDNDYSSHDCFYLNGLNDCVLDGLNGDSPRRNFIRISENHNDTGEGGILKTSTNRLTIRGAMGYNVGMDGLVFDFAAESVRDVDVDITVVGSGAAGHYAIMSTGTESRFPQPNIVSYKQRGFEAGADNVSGGYANLKLVDRMA